MPLFVRIADLARVLHSASNRRKVLFVLAAYFDASFTEPKGITSIGGFIGNADEWQRVEDEWVANLAKWQIQEFHLAKLPEMVGFERAALCARSFAKIINKSELHGISAALDDRDWAELPEDQRGSHPYYDCIEMLFDLLQEHARCEYKGEPVAVIVDNDIKPPEAVHAIFDVYKQSSGGQLSSLTVTHRANCRALECADLAAGQWRKGWLDRTFPQIPGFVDAGVIGNRMRATFRSKETAARLAEFKAKVRKDED